MKWERFKVAGDTVWGIDTSRPYFDTEFIWEIRVTGTDSSDHPTQWGVWFEGEPVCGKPSKMLKHNGRQLCFNRVADAKAFVERSIVAKL